MQKRTVPTRDPLNVAGFYKKPDLFATPCAKTGRCTSASDEPHCEHAVTRSTAGDWFITFGHAGYNSRANNGFGYKAEPSARAAIARLTSR